MENFFSVRIASFKYAFSGLFHVLRTQGNSWIHLLATILSIFLAYWLRLPTTDWAIVVLTIVMVWTAEIMNTAIETLVNLISPQEHPLAKIIKDVSAAGVLIAALGSIFIGLLLLGPPLWLRINSLISAR